MPFYQYIQKTQIHRLEFLNRKLDIKMLTGLTMGMTSGGTVRGMDLAFSHKALSLVQVHTAGHLALLVSSPQSAERR